MTVKKKEKKVILHGKGSPESPAGGRAHRSMTERHVSVLISTMSLPALASGGALGSTAGGMSLPFASYVWVVRV